MSMNRRTPFAVFLNAFFGFQKYKTATNMKTAYRLTAKATQFDEHYRCASDHYITGYFFYLLLNKEKDCTMQKNK